MNEGVVSGGMEGGKWGGEELKGEVGGVEVDVVDGGNVELMRVGGVEVVWVVEEFSVVEIKGGEGGV